MTRRLFVALEPSESCRELVRSAQATLAERFPDLRVRWQPTENLHLTLAFLGNVGADRVDACAERTRLVAAAHRGFSLETARLGAFPSAVRPSVLWLGVRADPPHALADLQHDVAVAFRDLHDDRKPFRPHLTLARVKGLGSTPRTELAQSLAELPAERSAWTVDAIVLFESYLASDGAVHRPIRVGTLAA